MTVSAVSVKLKFPEFSSEDNGFVEMAIEEASRAVDDTWLPGDHDLAILYYTAHIMAVSILRREGGQMVESERFGEIAITYKTPAQPKSTDSSDLTTTAYGTRFLELAHLNFPPVAVI